MRKALSDTQKRPGRFSPYGVFWTRFLHWAVSSCPWFVKPVFVAAYSALFVLICRDQRRAVFGNLQVLRPECSTGILCLGVYRVFWNFAWTMVEDLESRFDPGCLEWEVEGHDHFEALCQEDGAIIATAHMGSYDLAGAVFSDRMQGPVHAVRAPERDPAVQALREKQLRERGGRGFSVIYNRPGELLGITLAQALGRGEIVAIQADRILFEVAELRLPWQSWEVAVPKGPFILAQTTGCPIYPLFIKRMGRRRYRIHIEESFVCQRVGRDRAAGMRQAGEIWLQRLHPHLRDSWYQWFVFEGFFHKAGQEGAE